MPSPIWPQTYFALASYCETEPARGSFSKILTVVAILTCLCFMCLAPLLGIVHAEALEQAVKKEREEREALREERLRRYLTMATGDDPRRHQESDEQTPLLHRETQRGFGSGFDDRVPNDPLPSLYDFRRMRDADLNSITINGVRVDRRDIEAAANESSDSFDTEEWPAYNTLVPVLPAAVENPALPKKP
ncbi:hypothetical protein F4678DRAFT_458160 [Xylaria arbuscula]|nr:hypothetical protein F4678DRAFT_458160 [Xylaria arbuscula]